MDIYEEIKTKPIIIIGQGPSVHRLRGNIEMFRGHDILWGSLNRFHVAEDEILKSIGADFDIIWFSALLRYEEMHEHLKRAGKRGSLIMTKTAVAEYFDFPANIYASDFGAGFSSLFAMLCALMKLGAKNIYLVGFDGHATNPADVYYGQDKLHSDNYESRMRSIGRDTKMMNIFFWEYVQYAINKNRSLVSVTNLLGSSIKCFPSIDIRTMAEKSGKGIISPGIEDKKNNYKKPMRKMRVLQLFVSPQYGNVDLGQIIDVSPRLSEILVKNRLAEYTDVAQIEEAPPLVKRQKRRRKKVIQKKIESYYTLEHPELLERLDKIFK